MNAATTKIHAPLPQVSGISPTLLPFQKEAVSKMLHFLQTKGGVYNGCEMRLGKTCQTIECIKQLQELLPPIEANPIFLGMKYWKEYIPSFFILIICPTSVKYVWEEEIKKWSLEGNVQVVQKKSDSLLGNTITIMSYEIACAKIAELKALHFDLIILDEAHYIKTLTAKRSRALIPLIKNIKYKIFLSGTPFTRSIVDGYTQFQILLPSLGTFQTFANKYSEKRQIKIKGKNGQTFWRDVYYGVKNASQLKKILYDNFLVRYKMKDVLPEMPRKSWQEVPFKVNTKTLSRLEYEQVESGEATIATRRINDALKALPQGIEFIKNLLDNDIPVVLFGWHLEVINKYKEALKDYIPAILTGSTLDKSNEIRTFQDGVTNLFIGQIKASSLGINLSRASTIIFLELDYSPSNIAQAAARCDALSKTEPVQVYYFTYSELDRAIYKVLIDKARSFNEVLNTSLTYE